MTTPSVSRSFRSAFLCCLALLISLCFWTAEKSLAQEPDGQQGGLAPPPPDFFQAPPPEPDSLLQPELEWEPLGPLPEAVAVPAPAPPLVVPLPLPEPVVFSPQPDPPLAQFVEGEPDPAQFALVTPRVEIWREGAEEPDIPEETEYGWDLVLVEKETAITVRLLFDPSLTGKSLAVASSAGVTVQPAESTINIGPSGECLFTVSYDGSEKGGGTISFYSKAVTTELRLRAAPPGVLNP